MTIQLSDTFNYRKLIRFTLPTVLMMMFISFYCVIDGYFVSNHVGSVAFSAINFITPYWIVLGALGFMFGTGGSALVAKSLGEGNAALANEEFSFITYATIISGVLLSVLGIAFLRPLAIMLGAEGEMLEYSVLYGRIVLLALPPLMVMYLFESLFATAECPKMGLCMTVVGGVTNILLDYVIIVWLNMGVLGAALATAISQLIGGIIPIVFFSRPNKTRFRFTKTKLMWRTLGKACSNGISEMVSCVSISIVAMFYNAELLKIAGSDGIAAYGVMLYVSGLFVSIYEGYVVGVSPIISYKFGDQNHKELKSVLKKSIVIIGALSLALFALSELLASPLTKVYVGYSEKLMEMTKKGFVIFSCSFLFVGFTSFASAFFTALNNGMVSAIISFSHTFVFQIISVLILPEIFGLAGIWLSTVSAPLLAMIVILVLFIKLKDKYHYW